MARDTVLAFDFGSRTATAAAARGGELLSVLSTPRAGRDADLLPLLERTLERAAVARSALAGVVALAGPGSFTGIRVACATALGLGAGLAIPAHGLSTLDALALAAPGGARRIVAVVDALRGEWFAQRFERDATGMPRAAGGPTLVSAAGVEIAEAVVIGEDADRFVAAASGAALAALRPGALAAAAALAARSGALPGSAELLRRPLYLRPPATRLAL